MAFTLSPSFHPLRLWDTSAAHIPSLPHIQCWFFQLNGRMATLKTASEWRFLHWRVKHQGNTNTELCSCDLCHPGRWTDDYRSRLFAWVQHETVVWSWVLCVCVWMWMCYATNSVSCLSGKTTVYLLTSVTSFLLDTPPTHPPTHACISHMLSLTFSVMYAHIAWVKKNKINK